MAQKVKMTGPDGNPQELAAYNDNRALAADYMAGAVKDNELIIYASSMPMVAQVLGVFMDEDGEMYTSLLLIAPLGNVVINNFSMGG